MFGLGPEGLPGALGPPRCLRQPALADHRAGEYRVGDAGGLVLAPAVPPRQLDRLPAPSLSPRPGPEGRGYRPVRQAEELEVGPPDPAGQGPPPLPAPVGPPRPPGV